MHYISSIFPPVCKYISSSRFFTVNAGKLENDRLSCILCCLHCNKVQVSSEKRKMGPKKHSKFKEVSANLHSACTSSLSLTVKINNINDVNNVHDCIMRHQKSTT